MSTLEDRCRTFLIDTPPRDGPEALVRDLRDFVLSEIGRAANPEALSDSSALVLYFASDEGRQMIVDALVTENPNLIERKWP